MTPDARRRLGALTALVLGLFIGLTLLPFPLTGRVGAALGELLWRALGVGALALPTLGLGLALAGFDRLGSLDMKRAAVLCIGLGVLVPYFVGILGRVTPNDIDTGSLVGRFTGVAPGLFATWIPDKVGLAGAVLLGFLALSAVTLVTLAWHPLQRLEGGEAARRQGGQAASAAASRPVGQPPSGVEEAFRGTSPADPVGVTLTSRAGPLAAVSSKRKDKKPAVAAEAVEDTLPPIDLLHDAPSRDQAQDEQQIARLKQSLQETLRTFKVEVDVGSHTSGPVVTQVEVIPAPGVKAQRIVALADDLAMAMRTPSIRVAPIPGKGAVGVEVPNTRARVVTLRELFESDEWTHAKAPLPIALGADLEGKPVIADLTKTPHLLIAGATGSGKSVAINTIITSLIYRYTAKQLRLLLVDPKMVELSVYNVLPHLRHKVVTDNRDAATVLKWAVFEMNRRYELLQVNGARNLADFNRKAEEGKPLRNPPRPKLTLATMAEEPSDTPPAPLEEEVYSEGALPYIVLIIDELADLMMTVQAEVETPLAILAQKARAIGIHLILATQRPSVNVITGLIKANFPSRIAFRVASKVDSRTILDQNGAESLLGNGDMLFVPPGRNEPVRLQGAFIATEETERIMQWFVSRREAQRVAASRPAEHEESDILALIRAQEAEAEGGSAERMTDEKRDALFRQAAELCVQNQGGSTSLLQRRLSIGYGRAARLIDQLHFAGILGPPDGSKPREVLIGFDQLDEYTG